MKKHPLKIAAALALAGVGLALGSAQADEKRHSELGQLPASDLIGKKVKSAQDEDLGRVQEFIVNLDSGTVPYVVIAHGGTLGAGRTKTAVPLKLLQCSTDGKSFVLPASKEQFQAAAKTAAGTWASVENQEWTKSVDAFYSQPDRHRSDATDGTRQYVRDPQLKGAERLIQPSDEALVERISDALDTVQVYVDNGTATLCGTVGSEAERDSIETKVRATPGVQRVESHLKIKNR